MKRLRAALLLIIFSTVFFAPAISFAATKPTPKIQPRRANLFLSWTVTDDEATQLAQWDLIVLDAEIGRLHPEIIRKIRAINPSIIIVCYISSNELHTPASWLASAAPLRAELLSQLTESNFLHHADGSRVSFWPETNMLNITGSWQQILPQFVNDKILSTGLWDGIMLDNVWESISGYVGDVGIPNATWGSAEQSLINNFHQLAPNALIIANGSTKFSGTDGVVFESFPKDGFTSTINLANKFDKKLKGNSFMILNTAGDVNSEDSKAACLRFNFASAHMANAYASCDRGPIDHGATWWTNEYDVSLGKPTADAKNVRGIWRRNFEHGAVIANPSSKSGTINLGATYDVNGRRVQTVSLNPQDGALLLTPISTVDLPLRHPDVYTEFYTNHGAQLHAPITIVKNGSDSLALPLQPLTQIIDISGDNHPDIINISSRDQTALITVVSNNIRTAQFMPFASERGTAVRMMIGKFDTTNTRQIVAVLFGKTTIYIKIFSLTGQLRNSFTIPKNPDEYVGVLVSDVDGDGISDITTLRQSQTFTP